jgi:protein O-GlcNAc transferase
MEISKSLAKALPLHRAGDLDAAEKMYLSVLEQAPDHPDALHLLGLVKRQRGRPAEALPYLEKAFDRCPGNAQFLIDYADCFRENKDFGKALRHYERALDGKPAAATLHFKMAECSHALGDTARAREHLQRTLALEPDHFGATFDLAELYRGGGDFERARGLFKKALALKPDFAAGHHAAGLIEDALGNPARALHHLREAVRLDHGLAAAHNDLGNLLLSQGETAAAIDSYRQALAVKPDFHQAYFNLGNCLRSADRLDDALCCFAAALKADPFSVRGLSNYGEALMAAGRVSEARENFERAVSISKGRCGQAFSNLLLSMNYDPDVSSRRLFEKHVEFGRVFNEAPLPREWSEPGSGRKVRIGYVSADFCNHPAARFMEPLIVNHDDRLFEVFCYSDAVKPDFVTKRLKNACPNWRDISHSKDGSALEVIRNDRVDILVDCAGHTGGNRLGLFAKKPAALHLSSFGYPATTGLAAMDYYMTDAVLDPGEDADRYTEKLLRIAPCFCCYKPLPDAPVAGHSPAAKNGFVTFGSLHTLARLNDRVIELWSAVLKSIPDSRLRIIRTTLSGKIRNNLESKFSSHGVDPRRIDMTNEIPLNGHLSLYHTIDISLDTFPWSGHTTACESLWMGVPVVTLHGDRHAGRMVSSVLTVLGLTDWIGRSVGQYLSIAIKKAGAIEALISLRSRLRDIMTASDLCNAEKYAGKVEALYKRIWQDYCARIS